MITFGAKMTNDARVWLRAMVLFCVALFPFELLISVVRYKLTLAIGPAGFLLHPAVPLVIGCVLLMGMRVEGNRYVIFFLALYSAGIVISGLVTGSSAYYVISTVLLGPGFMAFVVAWFEDELFLRRIIAAFVISMAIWCVIFAILFCFTVPIILSRRPEWLALPVDRLFFALRLPGDSLIGELLYFKILGNYNKQSNILVLSVILATYCYVRNAWSWRIWAAALFPMAVMTLLMFSRGALVTLALTGAALAVTALFRNEKKPQLIAAVSMLTIFLASISTAGLRDYWKNTGSLDQREEIFASAVSASNARFLKSGEFASLPPDRETESKNSADARGPTTEHPVTPSQTSPESRAKPSQEVPPNRVTPSQPAVDNGATSRQAPTDDGAPPHAATENRVAPVESECEARVPEKTLAFYVFGYGLGHFGPTMCRFPEGESHNTFLDAWIQGGVIGLIGYIGIFVVAITIGGWRLFRSRFRDQASLYGLAIVLAVVALGMREYAFVYLWVQSAGGFLLAIGLVLATGSRRNTVSI